MPAVPIIAAVVTTAATVYSAQQANSRARKATDLARRNSRAQNQASANAAIAARERDQTAQVVEANQAAASAEMEKQPEVIVSDANQAARRRDNRSTFRIDDETYSQSLRV